ncbi:hypothetical protein BDY17DRAFT_309330 [Neohortaea acidophila]|uniref:DUF1445 domain-containing protein n=1 Tax=Neohortaea acidophila TaxID=245834 RepID=A0A6A6PW69_9PEZI|nr:uncharacterized protein BDY17DRAFT_309330 [Neohortaea acidophila]KAF2483981.1 hypothetical protein BDY17DRAFT_309330 [Neohortaea acidophila]
MAQGRTATLPTTVREVRKLCRANLWDAPTSGVAPGYLQANLIVLPAEFAPDFEILCARNTVPCPLLAISKAPGDFTNFQSRMPGIADSQIAFGLDIRHDLPRYNVYKDGVLVADHIDSLEKHWDPKDHVAFLIGCSFSFEDALTKAGLPPAHIARDCTVPMYRTKIPLCPAGAFTGSKYVVSMRYYHESEVSLVRDVTRRFIATHGEPIAWGWDSLETLGITNIDRPDWGDPPVIADDSVVVRSVEEHKTDGIVPVFWGCGVTPQEAVMKARIPGIVMGHAPGHMLVMDVKEADVFRPS